jgi:DNA-binding CsgD family transcriptional regulator
LIQAGKAFVPDGLQMKLRIFVAAVLLVQVVCSAFFVSDILFSVLGVRTAPLDWQLRELLEICAALGLVLGVVLGAMALRGSMSGDFMELLTERFTEWGLTPAERDVALFAIKGLSTAEIATLRATSEGTVKAQTNAIYRKAGVSGRSQLLSLFIEDLMRDDLGQRSLAQSA